MPLRCQWYFLDQCDRDTQRGGEEVSVRLFVRLRWRDRTRRRHNSECDGQSLCTTSMGGKQQVGHAAAKATIVHRFSSRPVVERFFVPSSDGPPDGDLSVPGITIVPAWLSDLETHSETGFSPSRSPLPPRRLKVGLAGLRLGSRSLTQAYCWEAESLRLSVGRSSASPSLPVSLGVVRAARRKVGPSPP
jgi:hypothetical protein